MSDFAQLDRVKQALRDWNETTSDLDLMNSTEILNSDPPSSASVLIPIISRAEAANVILTPANNNG